MEVGRSDKEFSKFVPLKSVFKGQVFWKLSFYGLQISGSGGVGHYIRKIRNQRCCGVITGVGEVREEWELGWW